MGYYFGVFDVLLCFLWLCSYVVFIDFVFFVDEKLMLVKNVIFMVVLRYINGMFLILMVF